MLIKNKNKAIITPKPLNAGIKYIPSELPALYANSDESMGFVNNSTFRAHSIIVPVSFVAPSTRYRSSFPTFQPING